MSRICRIEFLGWLRVIQQGRTISRFRSYKTGVLLAYLAYYADRPHPRDFLIEMLWPDCDPASGRDRLSTCLSSLRHQLEPPGVPAGNLILADRNSVQINPVSCTSDVLEFEAAIRAANDFTISQTSPLDIRTLPHLAEAVRLYRGELLPGHYEDWNLAERERLSTMYLSALDRLIVHLEQTGDTEQALTYARQAVRTDPLREESHAHVIRLLIATGADAAALRQYRQVERILRDELELTPSPETRALIVRLATGTAHSRPTEVAPVSRAASSRSTAAMPDPAARQSAVRLSGAVTLVAVEVDNAPGSNAHIARELRRFHGQGVSDVGSGAGGVVVGAFGRARDALECALAIFQTGPQTPGRLRAGMHTGELRSGRRRQSGSRLADSPDPVIECAVQLLVAARPGQILCSEVTATLLRRDLPPDFQLVHLGAYRLKGAAIHEYLYSVDYPGKPEANFTPPDAQPDRPDSLPLPLTRFFGRKPEIAELRTHLVPPCNSSR